MSDSHYFDRRPSVASKRRQVALSLPDLDLALVADRGVFSGDRIDPGTKYLLMEAPALPATGDLLDLGCGYGPIALTMARRAPAATVWAVDVNERALALVRENAAAAGASNVRAVLPDEVPDELRFTAIWSNPPVRVGKQALHELLVRWLGRLTDDGVAVLVVQKHLGSDSLARWLGEQGYRVERLGSRMAYRLLEVRPR